MARSLLRVPRGLGLPTASLLTLPVRAGVSSWRAQEAPGGSERRLLFRARRPLKFLAGQWQPGLGEQAGQDCHLSYSLEHSHFRFLLKLLFLGTPHCSSWLMQSCPYLRVSIIVPLGHISSYPLSNSLMTDFPGRGQR